MTGMTVETAAGFAVQPIGQGDLTAVVFKMHDGSVIGAALNQTDISRLACRLITEAMTLASKQTPTTPPESLTADPIPATAVGVGRGRSDTEALLTFRLGNLDMTFALELSSVLQMCGHVQKAATVTAPRKPN